MASGIFGFLTALPELLAMIKSFIKWINKISGNDPSGLALKVNAAFTQLNQAKTESDYAQAAKNISNLIAGFPAK